MVETVKAKFRVWRIAIYIRLSKEDARCLDESESVTNQRAIIEDHIAGFNDGDAYIIVDEYVDDGISGRRMTSATTSSGCWPILSGAASTASS